MANYKKLTDVEVMEEVSENSMALVNENGVLKQVPCGAGFGGGGVNFLVIKYDADNGNRLANMTPTEFIDGLNNGTIYGGTLYKMGESTFNNGFNTGYVDSYCLANFVCNDTYIHLEFVSDGDYVSVDWNNDGSFQTAIG